MTKITILGAAGRMGGALIRGIANTPGLALAAAVDRADHPMAGKDAGITSGIAALNIPITGDRATAIAKADVVIDFTFHSEAPASIQEAVKINVAYVLGTTGLTDAEADGVKQAATKIPVVWAPNFSLGVNVLLDLVRRAAKVLDDSYDAEIVEMHHKHKKDAPSGTALGLGKALAQGRNVDLKDVALYGREGTLSQGITGERKRGDIAFHALRGGDVVGDHTVIFAADGERVEITHKASNRDCFALGALKAAQWLKGKQPGLYSMTDVLGL